MRIYGQTKIIFIPFLGFFFSFFYISYLFIILALIYYHLSFFYINLIFCIFVKLLLMLEWWFILYLFLMSFFKDYNVADFEWKIYCSEKTWNNFDSFVNSPRLYLYTFIKNFWSNLIFFCSSNKIQFYKYAFLIFYSFILLYIFYHILLFIYLNTLY